MTIVDAIIILFILTGAVLGFKKGAIRSLVALVGTILLVVVSYYLKDPLAAFFMEHLPFLNFSGSFQNLVVLNVLLYESLAYVLIFAGLSIILSLCLKLSGIVEKILNATIILGIPSKIIGAVLGFIEAVVFSFIILFVLLQLNLTHELVMESSVARSIIDKTPIIGTMVNDTYQAITDINGIIKEYNNTNNSDELNKEILRIMLKYDVISLEETQKLIDSNKLPITGIQNVVQEYEGGE